MNTVTLPLPDGRRVTLGEDRIVTDDATGVVLPGVWQERPGGWLGWTPFDNPGWTVWVHFAQGASLVSHEQGFRFAGVPEEVIDSLPWEGWREGRPGE